MARSVLFINTREIFIFACLQIVTPLNPATREQENLDKWMEKEENVPLGRIGQVWQAKGLLFSLFTFILFSILQQASTNFLFLVFHFFCSQVNVDLVVCSLQA